VAEDSVNLSAYFAWSLLDNFEWNEGYRPRFGLVHVDRDNPDFRRYPKLSAYWLSHHFFKLAPDRIACLGARARGRAPGGRRALGGRGQLERARGAGGLACQVGSTSLQWPAGPSPRNTPLHLPRPRSAEIKSCGGQS
jgi:hypothetical protein